MGGDTRRSLLRRANAQGLTVKGRNGEVRPAILRGHRRRDFAKACVNDEFATIFFDVKWQLVRAIAEGHIQQLTIRSDRGRAQPPTKDADAGHT
jgi:hypothetical protein